MVMSQSHDFEVRDFHENMTDLTAATSNIKDLNGVTAALIRFAIRDPLFSFDTNIGVLKEEKETGEVLLYVPQGTKRITIRHPQLGILRDYQIPVPIKAKTTYDAEIVITNEDYNRSLLGNDQRPVTVEPVAVEPPPVATAKPKEEKPVREEKPVKDTDDLYQSRVKQHKSFSFPEPHFLLGGGFSALNMMGPSITAGIQLGTFILSADYTIGVQKVEGVGIYYKTSGYDEGLTEAYDYSANRFSIRLGIGAPKASFQVVPQIGASFYMIKGKKIVDNIGSEAHFTSANPLSLTVALSFRIRLFDSLYLTTTPQYDFVVGKDDVYDIIKDADKTIKGWGDGFGVNAGLLYRF